MALQPAAADERRPIGVGMLGYGFMGRAHGNALRTIPYMFWPSGHRPELVAISGRTEAAVREAATRYGWPSWTTDWRDVIADPRVQVFDNCGPDPAHFEPSLAAVRAGKHVICEKPLAVHAPDAEALHRAAEAAGVKHLTCFNYRFLPGVRLARELIDQGELGEIHQARFRYSQEWRTDRYAPMPSPTGALKIIGVHAIDQARYLIGEIESVQAAVTSPVTDDRRTWNGEPAEQVDTAAMVAHFESGVVGTIDCSLVSPGRQNMLAWEINGAKASIAWNLEDLNVLRVHRRTGERTRGFTEVMVTGPEHVLAAPWWPGAHILGWEHGHNNMLAHFLDAVANDTPVGPHDATFADGARASRIVEAAQESAAAGQRVSAAAPAPEPAEAGP